MINTYKPEGVISSCAKNREYLNSGKAGLEKAMALGVILEGNVLLCDEEMNLHVDLHGIVGIIPREEVCYSASGQTTKDIAIITRVGRPVCFKIISIESSRGQTVAYLSRREAQIDCMRNYISSLIPGDIISARVTHLATFGAFVDIGCGIIALLPVDCISISRFSHPKDRLYCGMIINTVLKSVDREKDRIFVTMRELLGTWEENAALFSPGQTVAGIIRSIESYGVFVELTPNLAGLAELREDSAETLHDAIGKTVAVYIKSIIPERMKIKLVLVDSYKSDALLPSFKYYIDCDANSHIDYWRYSPSFCPKVIETAFEM